MKRYDLADRYFLQNPVPMLAEMRAEGSLVEVKFPIIGRIWITTTHAATAEVAKGKDRFFLTGAGAGLNDKRSAALPWYMPRSIRAMTHNMLGMDDPDHRRLRKLVDQAFARRGIRDMRPEIAAQATSMARVLGGGQSNLVPGFSRALPLAVIAELLGLPEADRADFAAQAGALGDLGGPVSFFKLMWRMGQLHRSMRRVIEQMRRAPQPGLITDLIAVEENGDSLSEEELVAMVFLLLFAGFETTTNLISGAVLALERNPEQKAWLLDDFDGRIERATEELCRIVSAVSGTKPRLVARDTEVQGMPIKRGAKVMALPVAANYDPAVFDAPERLDLDRFPNPHLSFSTGAHFCLGMQLARVELQEALRALYGAWPDLRVADAGPIYAKRPGHRAITEMGVSLT